MDYGFVEAEVGGNWVTVPLEDDNGTEVTTDTNPFGTNTEGNGLTGTSGGVYFVDDPEYIHLSAELPAGTTDVRFRYSTDPAYLDTGWFVDDVQVNGSAATVSSPDGDWFETSGIQDNNWILQIVSSCDLTPGTDDRGRDAGRRPASCIASRATRSIEAGFLDQVHELDEGECAGRHLEPADG